ncbi:MAG: hypothetical protein QXU79_04020 [Candidatus Micrarchaeaceae archaeon]
MKNIENMKDEKEIEKRKVNEYRDHIDIHPIPKDGFIVSLKTIVGSNIVKEKKIYLSDIFSSVEGNEWISPVVEDENDWRESLELYKIADRWDHITKKYNVSYISLGLTKTFISTDGVRVFEKYSVILNLESNLIIIIPIYENPFPEFVSD